MYKKRIKLDDLVKDANLLTEMTDGDVYQVIHLGNVRVLLTQDHYFDLMARLEKTNGTNKTTKYDPAELMSDFEKSVLKN